MPRTHRRTLTDEGKKEFGHIFGDYVPLIEFTPTEVGLEGNRDGEPQLVFLVAWQALTIDQQGLVLAYMTEKFGAPEGEILDRIESDGHFPIRHKYVIESYDMRHFI